MAQITEELKMRIFAAYFGAKVFGDTQDEEYVNYQEFEMDYDNLSFCVNESIQLVLSPLSNITEEHAIEVAKIIEFEMGCIGDKPAPEYMLRGAIVEELAKLFSHAELENIGGLQFQNLIDYLRSESYDCGYGSIKSLIEEGVAIPKSINKTENNGS